MIRIFGDTLYVEYIYMHIYTYDHRDSSLYHPLYPTTMARVRSQTSRHPPSPSCFLPFSLLPYISLFSPPRTLSSSLSLSIYICICIYIPTATLSVTNPLFQPPAAVVVRSPRQVESGAFPPPTNGRRETPPWLRGGGDTFYP